MAQYLAGIFNDTVFALAAVTLCKGYGVVWENAVLGADGVAVVHGTGGEAYAPTARQLAGEGKSGSAAGLVADDGDAGTAAHVFDELVGGTEHGPVGKDGDGFLPPHAFGGLQSLLLEGGEGIVGGSGLVPLIANEDFFVSEPAGQLLGGGELSASVVADIDDEGVAGSQEGEHVVKVSGSDAALERAAIDVSDVVVEDAIAQGTGYLVVGLEIVALQVFGEILRIVLVPRPVAPYVERGIEVVVAVAELAEHVGQDFKLLCLGHVAVETGRIAGVDLVPVEAVLLLFEPKEAVVLVHDVPESFEIAFGRVGIFVLVDAGSETKEEEED